MGRTIVSGSGRLMHLPLKLPPIRVWGPSALIAVLAWTAVVCTLDPAGNYPGAPAGPGLTVDEVFNVQQGAYLAEASRDYGLALLHPDSVREVFGHPNYLPDHPPLGRFWIGVFHNLTKALVPPAEPAPPFVTACARTAPATAFAILVFLLGWTATRWYGPVPGVVAAAAVVLMPRLFGHAHLASLETFIGLIYTATVVGVASNWSRSSSSNRSVDFNPREAQPRTSNLPSTFDAASPSVWPPPTWKTACLTGVLFGLALLMKIQAFLLPLPIAAWALFYWRRRAVVPLLVWGLTGLVVLFVGWPWLWLKPGPHLLEYLGRTTERAVLSVWYFGRQFADRDVPWHYPFVMFLTTVPIGLHVLGVCGMWCGERPGWKGPREQLLLACTVFPLVVFALSGVAVYDGARLFLVAFPLWALLLGRGGGIVFKWLRTKLPLWGTAVVLTVFISLQGYGLLALHPCYLSYYNVLVGGLRGAERLGLEPTYWGDSITRSLLEETVAAVPAGATIEMAPALHQFQLEEMTNQSPILRRHRITLRPLQPADAAPIDGPRYILVFRRKADLPEWLRDGPPNAKTLAEVRRQGVWLAALFELN